MGSVMSYSLGLSGDRPAPAGILAFSGFVPVVDVLNACFLAPSGSVREQVPPPDTQAARGSEVTVFVCP